MNVRGLLRPAKSSLLRRYPAQGYVIILMLLMSSLLFVLGIFVPMLTLHKLIFFSNQISLVSALVELLAQKELILFFLIFVNQRVSRVVGNKEKYIV